MNELLTIDRIREAKRNIILPPLSYGDARMPNSGNDTSARMPTRGHPSFRGNLLGNTSGNRQQRVAKRGSPKAPVYLWTDAALKKHASVLDRTVMAVRDAATCACKKGVDPLITPIYVSDTIRKGWRLEPKDLSRSLSRLEKLGYIQRAGGKRKGKHARFTLVQRIITSG